MKLPFGLSHRASMVLDCFLLVALTAGLIRPLFKAKYRDRWESIEATFIADARFLKEHWPHPQWQPLWYTGTRFDYIYPPALRYGTAVISKTVGNIPAKAYHVYTALFYCIGIAGVYLLLRVGTGSRGAAWLGAAATALTSPSFLVLKNMRDDAWKLLPVRLGVLIKYGEGPHMTALALIPFALVFSWRAFESRRPWAVALAAAFSAAVVSNNFYGATALAVIYPILVWSFWITRQDKRIVLPALAIPALAYGLTAFWLVPSYFQVTAENMKYVSEHGTTWSIWLAAGVAIVYALASDKLARGKAERTWAVFTAGCVVFFSLNVLGNHYFNFRVSGEPHRLVPELDLIYVMAALIVLRWLWNRPGRAGKAVAAVVVLGAFATTLGYLRHAWQMFPLDPNSQERIEYKISDWMWKNMPEARACPSGTVRFWYDAWHDLAQLGGGSEQGLLNGTVQQAQWELMLGPDPEPGVLWMQSLAVDAVYVPDKNSVEPYKDVRFPQKFAGVLPVIYDDGHGNKFYKVPRRYPARARVVETARLNVLKRPRSNVDLEYMRAYVEVVEKGPDSPTTLTRNGPDEMRVRARVGPGQSVVVQESYDPAWQAWSAGKALPVRKDAMGLMVIDAPPGDHEIALAFITPMENQVGRVATILTVLVVVGLLAASARTGVGPLAGLRQSGSRMAKKRQMK